MTIMIRWTITEMNCYSQSGDNTDVVFMVHWICSGMDETQGLSVYCISSTASLSAPSNMFTPYADLTQDQVLDWVWASGVDKTATETAVEQYIQNRNSLPTATLSLPWLGFSLDIASTPTEL